jgi:cytochrome c oxidase cbb3-type subunit 4
MGVIRGALTLVLMLAFVGMVVYVYSKRNKSIYDQAARLPLEDATAANPEMNKESSGSSQS